MQIWIVGAALALAVSGAQAPQPGAKPGEAPTATAAVAPAPSAAPVPPLPVSAPVAPVIPALTPVSLEIGAALGSKTSKSGDTFPIRLHETIVVDGQELVPAGATGMGEVVDVRHSGMSGSSGYLVLAARFLEVDGQQLRLRSMHLTANGKSRTNLVNHLGVATAVAAPIAGVVLLFVSGSDIDVPPGSLAEAKTAENFVLGDGAPLRHAPGNTALNATERKVHE